MKYNNGNKDFLKGCGVSGEMGGSGGIETDCVMDGRTYGDSEDPPESRTDDRYAKIVGLVEEGYPLEAELMEGDIREDVVADLLKERLITLTELRNELDLLLLDTERRLKTVMIAIKRKEKELGKLRGNKNLLENVHSRLMGAGFKPSHNSIRQLIGIELKFLAMNSDKIGSKPPKISKNSDIIYEFFTYMEDVWNKYSELYGDIKRDINLLWDIYDKIEELTSEIRTVSKKIRRIMRALYSLNAAP